MDAGTVTDPRIDEASGLAVSRSQADVVWVHNDSGDSARVFALGLDGSLRGEFEIMGATAVDWEDIAIGPGTDPGADYLYIGDIGDNDALRNDIVVHRVVEPTVTDAPDPVAVSGVESFPLTYPNGPRNAETLLSDPQTGDLFVVTKEADGASAVYRFAFPQATDAANMGEEITTLTFGSGDLLGSPQATGGDMSADGSLVAIRSYTHAFAWTRAPGTELAAAFDAAPCRLPLQLEMQGETFAFADGAAAYYTLSEGTGQTLLRYDAF